MLVLPTPTEMDSTLDSGQCHGADVDPGRSVQVVLVSRSPQQSRLRDQRTAKRLGLYGEDEHPRIELEKMAGAVTVHFLLNGKGV
jgi:hypothetical protein